MQKNILQLNKTDQNRNATAQGLKNELLEGRETKGETMLLLKEIDKYISDVEKEWNILNSLKPNVNEYKPSQASTVLLDIHHQMINQKVYIAFYMYRTE